jgi:hypothetical protein
MLPATGCGRKIRTYRAAVDAGIVGADVVCPYETDTSAATVTAIRRADVQQDMAAMGTRSDFNLARKTQRLLMVVPASMLALQQIPSACCPPCGYHAMISSQLSSSPHTRALFPNGKALYCANKHRAGGLGYMWDAARLGVLLDVFE